MTILDDILAVRLTHDPDQLLNIVALHHKAIEDSLRSIDSLEATSQKSVHFVVGNELSGASSLECDYLDAGDGIQLAAALSAANTLASSGIKGVIVLKEGTYTLNTSITTPLNIPTGWTLRGSGTAGTVVVGRVANASCLQDVFSLSISSTLDNLKIVTPAPAAGNTTGNGIVSTKAYCTVKNIEIEFQQGSVASSTPFGVTFIDSSTPEGLVFDNIYVNITGSGTAYSISTGFAAVYISSTNATYVDPSIPPRVSNIRCVTSTTVPCWGVFSGCLAIQIENVYVKYGYAAVAVQSSFAAISGTVKGPSIHNAISDSRGLSTSGARWGVYLTVSGVGGTSPVVAGTRIDGVSFYGDANINTSSDAFLLTLTNSITLRDLVLSNVVSDCTVAGSGNIFLQTLSSSVLQGLCVSGFSLANGDVKISANSGTTATNTQIGAGKCRNITLTGGTALTNTYIAPEVCFTGTFSDAGTSTSRGRSTYQIIVGNSGSGDTLADCDYLDNGDCTQLQAALTAASGTANSTTVTVREVFIRRGVYKPTTALTVPTNVKVRGDERLTRFVLDGTNRTAFSLTSGNVKLSDISIRLLAPPSAGSGTSVISATSTGYRFENITVESSGSWNATQLGDESLRSVFSYQPASAGHSIFQNCTINFTVVGSSGPAFSGTNSNLLIGFDLIDKNVDSGGSLDRYTQLVGCAVIGCDVGYQLKGPIVAEGCIVRGSTTYGIRFMDNGSSTSPGAVWNGGFVNLIPFGAGIDCVGISVENNGATAGPNSTIISGCSILKPSGSGAATCSGVRTVGVVTRPIINACSIRNFQVGVTIAADADKASITNCQISGYSTSISDAGTATTTSANTV